MNKLCFIVICLLIPLDLFAHAVEYTILDKGVGVEARYADGMAMSFSATKVFSPDDPTKPFQEGATDKNGRFVFYPDKPGKWRIEVNDGMGHSLIADINVTDALTVACEDKHRPRRSIIETIIMGICIIFGITGIIFYLASRKMIKDKP